MAGMEHFLLILLALLIHGFNGQDDKGSSSSNNDNSISPNALPDLPNAIHYPIYVPSQYSPSSLSTGRMPFDPVTALSSTWMHSLSPSLGLMDWSASSPFLAEVYDEQQLLQQRDMLYQRREELRRQREKLKQQQQQQQQHQQQKGHQDEYQNEPMRDRYPNLIHESNPLIPKPVIDEEEEQRLPAASHDNSRKRTTTGVASVGSESSYIPGDTVFRDRQAAVREIPVSSLLQLHQRRQRIQRKESEQGRSPEAIHLHYFSSVRQ